MFFFPSLSEEHEQKRMASIKFYCLVTVSSYLVLIGEVYICTGKFDYNFGFKLASLNVD